MTYKLWQFISKLRISIVGLLFGCIAFSTITLSQMMALPAWNQCRETGNTFTISSTQSDYRLPVGCTLAKIDVWGAGGGGGGAAAIQNTDGGSGGSGAFVSIILALKGKADASEALGIQLGTGGGLGAGCATPAVGQGGGGGGITTLTLGTSSPVLLARIGAGGGGGGGDPASGRFGGRGGSGNLSVGENGLSGGGATGTSIGKGGSSLLISGGDSGATSYSIYETVLRSAGGYSSGNTLNYIGGNGGSIPTPVANAGSPSGGNGGECSSYSFWDGGWTTNTAGGGGGGGAGAYGGGGAFIGEPYAAASGGGGGSSFINTAHSAVAGHSTCASGGVAPCVLPSFNPGGGLTAYGHGGEGGPCNPGGCTRNGKQGGSALVVIKILR